MSVHLPEHLHSSVIESWSREDRDAEELFDQALLHTLKEDVIPRIGHQTVPDEVISQIVKVLSRASQVAVPSFDSIDSKVRGTVKDYPVVPRERFAYSCFDLLLTLCRNQEIEGSGEITRQEVTLNELRRVGSLAVLPLITRCRSVLSTFIADEELHGSIPFSRYPEAFHG